MILVDLMTGGFLVLVGQTVGNSRAKRRAKRSIPPPPICGCTHSLAMHDPTTGVCHYAGSVKQTIGYDSRDNPKYAIHNTSCVCRQYVGPVPVEMMLAQFRPREVAPGLWKGVDGPGGRLEE